MRRMGWVQSSSKLWRGVLFQMETRTSTARRVAPQWRRAMHTQFCNFCVQARAGRVGVVAVSTGVRGITCTARAPCAHRVTCWNRLWGKGHALDPWLLDAHALPTLGGGDDGGRHPFTI